MKSPIPHQLPVMCIGEGVLFPHALLPLFIFEEKYRKMLADTLAGSRIFALGHEVNEEVLEVACAGIVRACVANSDGTSHLVLHGVRRVRLHRWERLEPYRVAQIEPLRTTSSDPKRSVRLAREVRQRIERLAKHGLSLPKMFDAYLSTADDPEVISDVVSATLVTDAIERQVLLEELDTTARLSRLIEHLEGMSNVP